MNILKITNFTTKLIKKMKQQLKKTKKAILTLLFLFISILAFAQDENKDDITENGQGNWSTFETKVGSDLTASKSYYHVYLEINGITIIVDYLLNTGPGKYKVIEVKASKITSLDDGIYNLRNRCTNNQKILYDLLTSNTVTATVKVPKKSQANTANEIAISGNITLEKGVVFYVNSPKAQYLTFKKCDLCPNYKKP
jgi:hypothetical protein